MRLLLVLMHSVVAMLSKRVTSNTFLGLKYSQRLEMSKLCLLIQTWSLLVSWDLIVFDVD